MRIPTPVSNRGIALIIVMIVITFLSILVAGFAHSMNVETRLARNSNYDSEMEWLGRSGIELAKYVIGQQRAIAGEPWDSLNQKWAGGPGNSNSPIADVQLKDVPIGHGTISVTITDCERKFNINVADELILSQALIVMGVDASDIPPIVSSIQDWIDPDDDTHPNGAESAYYQTLDPPYIAKNGPIDDMNELFLIKGIVPEMVDGSSSAGRPSVSSFSRLRLGPNGEPEPVSYAIHLKDVFAPFGGRQININTASATTLQMVPEIDENLAQAIIKRRSGEDGADGTIDDTPFRGPGDLASVVGMPPQLVGAISRFFTVQSTTFEVEVEAKLDTRTRKFHAYVHRVDPNRVDTLSMYWTQ